MPLYNFKKKVKFYVVIDGLKYRVDIYPDLSFSQTFKESNRRVKTLHTQTNMFDAAIINEANPANFSFTMPIYTSAEIKPILDLLIDYSASTSEVTLKTADIYVDTGTDIFKLEKAVFQEGTFNISRADITTVSISGTASKLSKFGPTGTAIPGTLQTETSIASNFLVPKFTLISVNGVNQDNVLGVSIDIANEVSWLDNNTLHKSLAVTGPSDTTYPEGFVVSGRRVSGAIQKYVTNENIADVNTWAVNVPLNIWIANTLGAYTLKFTLPEVVYTNRLESAELFAQTYDFRLTSNPASLSTAVIFDATPVVYVPPVGDPSSGFDLYLPFSATNPTYRVGASTYTDITTIPGYIYTRSGAKGELNNLAVPADVVNDFASNVPAIMPGVGYWSRQALTNLLIRSQEFNTSWVLDQVTITPNSVVAPDGTTTADTIANTAVSTNHYAYQAYTDTVATYTNSVFAKAGGASWLGLCFIDNTIANGAFFNLSNGTIGTVAAGTTATITPCGNGWYLCSIYRTRGGGTSYGVIEVHTADNQATNRLGATSETLYIWQAQSLLGSHPKGGPIITTTASTGAVGLDSLYISKTLADVDFAVWVGITIQASTGILDFAFAFSDAGTGYLELLDITVNTSNGIGALVRSGGIDLYEPVITGPFNSGRVVGLLRRKAGRWQLFIKKPDGTRTSAAESAVLGMPNLTRLSPGGRFDSRVARAPIDGVYVKQGTFTDAEIDAILVAA